MTNVIKFPRAENRDEQSSVKLASELPSSKKTHFMRRMVQAVLNTLFFVFVMLWTPLRIVLALNVVWQFGKMCYHWNEGAIGASLPFIVSFALLTALTFLRANWKYKG